MQTRHNLVFGSKFYFYHVNYLYYIMYVGQCQRFFHQHEMSKSKMKNVPLSCSIPHMHPSLDN